MKSITALFLSLLISNIVFAKGVVDIEEVFEPKGSYPSDKYMKVGVIQWNPEASARIDFTAKEAEEYKQGNREAMAELIKQAAEKRATYISLSEFAVTGYPDIPELSDEEDNFRNRDDIKGLVEKVPGNSSRYFSKLAKDLNVYIQFGLAEVDSVTNKYYNTVVVLGPDGQIVAKYRKQHLFEIEEDFLEAGTKNVTFQTPAGKFGLIICSDAYADEVIEAYKASKVDVLSLSTSWARYNSGMTQFQATAQQAGAYLLAANQNYFPDSGVINPDGKTQSHIRQSRSTVAYGYLPKKAQIKKSKAKQK